MLKYDRDDARDILERASARETTARVAAAAVCKRFLRSSASASAATSCTWAASTPCVRRRCPRDLNAAADASPLRTLDCRRRGADDRLHRRDQASGQHARRHLRGGRRRAARRARLARVVGPQARRSHRRRDHVDPRREGSRPRARGRIGRQRCVPRWLNGDKV